MRQLVLGPLFHIPARLHARMPSMPTDLMPINEWGARARASCRTNLHSGLEDFIQDIIEIIGSEKVLLKQQARKHRREARPRPGFIQRFRHVLFWDMRFGESSVRTDLPQNLRSRKSLKLSRNISTHDMMGNSVEQRVA